MNPEQRALQARRITLLGSLFNLFLAALKFFAGVLGQSQAMIADALHSLSDLITDIVVLIGIRLAKKPTDKCHHWGHGKFETLSTVIIGIALGYAAISIGISGTGQLVTVIREGQLPVRPGRIAFLIAVVSIAAKEALYHSTVAVGKRIGSSSVVANAVHHRSDAFSSIGTALGVGAASFFGSWWTVLDPAAAVLVSAFILKTALGILKNSISELLEKSLPESNIREIESIACSVEGVSNPHNIRARMVGPSPVIELHIRVASDMDVYHAHEISSALEARLRERFGEYTFITVHIEPD
ncbi:cation diffusion facilitator family transporter [Chitinispirillales bacterium ANBcel5]|uniref:cation diffusion facilitator family transporter n=1 Tax=Cellulosispirillum alkaliphilum TaxID=3039283 RepID=UPI002A527C57|nr:cation diffusion facilitator family transporter [Chitinispirillales bacterium ANBcel5]